MNFKLAASLLACAVSIVTLVISTMVLWQVQRINDAQALEKFKAGFVKHQPRQPTERSKQAYGLQTINCVHCGGKADIWTGHVKINLIRTESSGPLTRTLVVIAGHKRECYDRWPKALGPYYGKWRPEFGLKAK